MASLDPMYMYITFDILPLQKCIPHRIALMMYNYSHGMLPLMIQDLYVTNNAVQYHATHHSDLLQVPFTFTIKVF